MDENYLYRFGGIERLYGREALEVFYKSHIAVIGLGGVGSWTAEALARSGVGQLSLIDFDDICVSNTNRQLHAMDGNIGSMKTSAIKERILKINPQCQVRCIEEAYSPETEEMLFDNPWSGVVDAIDSAKTKYHLVQACHNRHIPLVVVGSAGGRRNPTQIFCDDLSKSECDPMLALLRKNLRQKARYPRKGKMKIETVFSKEMPYYLQEDGQVSEEKPHGFGRPLDCATGFGTASFVTGTFGLVAAQKILEKLLPATAD